MPRTTVVGVYDGGTYSALERVNDHVAEPPAHEPRQRLWRIFARRCDPRRRRHRAAAGVRRQRPSRHHAGRRRARLSQPLRRRAGRRAVVFGTNDETARTVADLNRAGVHVAAVVDPRASVPGEHRGRGQVRRCAAHRRRRRSRGRMGSLRVRAVDIRTASGETVRIDCDLVCVSGGWSPTVHLDLASRRAPRLERAPSRPSCPARCRKA